MKQIEKTASATNFTAINLGKLNELGVQSAKRGVRGSKTKRSDF